MKVLKPEYQELYDDFSTTFVYGGCTCHTGNPPCSYCTHEGDPNNLFEQDDTYEHDYYMDELKIYDDIESDLIDWYIGEFKIFDGRILNECLNIGTLNNHFPNLYKNGMLRLNYKDWKVEFTDKAKQILDLEKSMRLL